MGKKQDYFSLWLSWKSYGTKFSLPEPHKWIGEDMPFWSCLPLSVCFALFARITLHFFSFSLLSNFFFSLHWGKSDVFRFSIYCLLIICKFFLHTFSASTFVLFFIMCYLPITTMFDFLKFCYFPFLHTSFSSIVRLFCFSPLFYFIVLLFFIICYLPIASLFHYLMFYCFPFIVLCYPLLY